MCSCVIKRAKQKWWNEIWMRCFQLISLRCCLVCFFSSTRGRGIEQSIVPTTTTSTQRRILPTRAVFWQPQSCQWDQLDRGERQISFFRRGNRILLPFSLWRWRHHHGCLSSESYSSSLLILFWAFLMRFSPFWCFVGVWRRRARSSERHGHENAKTKIILI